MKCTLRSFFYFWYFYFPFPCFQAGVYLSGLKLWDPTSWVESAQPSFFSCVGEILTHLCCLNSTVIIFIQSNTSDEIIINKSSFIFSRWTDKSFSCNLYSSIIQEFILHFKNDIFIFLTILEVAKGLKDWLYCFSSSECLCGSKIWFWRWVIWQEVYWMAFHSWRLL